MSEERRKRQQERLGIAPTSNLTRNLVIAALLVSVLGAAYYIRKRRRNQASAVFAKCLAVKQVKMYGLYWCTHCEAQKELFGPAFQYVPYVECGVKGSTAEAPMCTEAGIKDFPTWQFPDGAKVEGERSLETLSEMSGCSLQ